MAVQEAEGFHAVNLVSAVKPIDGASVGKLQAGRVEVADLGKLEPNSIVGPHGVPMPALDHEGPRRNEGRHLRIPVSGTQVPLENIRFGLEDVTHFVPARSGLRYPFVEVPRADCKRKIGD